MWLGLEYKIVGWSNLFVHVLWVYNELIYGSMCEHKTFII